MEALLAYTNCMCSIDVFIDVYLIYDSTKFYAHKSISGQNQSGMFEQEVDKEMETQCPQNNL